MEGVPVLCPAGQSLVQAAVEHQAIPLSVLYDACFLVKYRLTCQKTSADGITGNGYADVQEVPGNHPGEQLQAVVQFPVMPGGFRRFLCLGTVRKGRAQETGFHGLLQRLAQQDGVDFRLFQGAAADEAHVPFIGHQAFDAGGGGSQRSGREKACGAVVAYRTAQGRDVKRLQKIAIRRRILALPCVVLQVRHRSHPEGRAGGAL